MLGDNVEAEVDLPSFWSVIVNKMSNLKQSRYGKDLALRKY